jgi:hypothetical protein
MGKTTIQKQRIQYRVERRGKIAVVDAFSVGGNMGEIPLSFD